MSASPFPNAPQGPWHLDNEGAYICDAARTPILAMLCPIGQTPDEVLTDAERLAAAAPWLALLVRLRVVLDWPMFSDADGGWIVGVGGYSGRLIRLGKDLYSPSPETFAAVLAAVEEAEKTGK